MNSEHSGLPRWNRARIVFESAPVDAPRATARRSASFLVYGDTEFAVLRALKKLFPHHTEFTILDLQLTGL